MCAWICALSCSNIFTRTIEIKIVSLLMFIIDGILCFCHVDFFKTLT